MRLPVPWPACTDPAPGLEEARGAEEDPSAPVPGHRPAAIAGQ